MDQNTPRHRFLKAMQVVYGPFDDLTSDETDAWVPPDDPGAGGHRGRYLWTDAFGVVNFITLFKETGSERYLTLAKRLVAAVHGVLGWSRDGSARLEGATSHQPLRGGLRIGKMRAEGPDGDGQYHHYLTIWMFALNRLSIATGDAAFNDLAVELAEAIHPSFFRYTVSGELKMVWKISVDMKRALVPSEGRLDAATGYVIFQLLRDTALEQGREEDVLFEETQDYASMMASRARALSPSGDPLDLGMGLWMCQFCDEVWARTLKRDALLRASRLLDRDSLSDSAGERSGSVSRRLAFREFGMFLGVEVCCAGAEREEARERIMSKVNDSLRFWERQMESQEEEEEEEEEEDLKPISRVMYSSALIPGAFRQGYLES